MYMYAHFQTSLVAVNMTAIFDLSGIQLEIPIPKVHPHWKYSKNYIPDTPPTNDDYD